MAKDIEQGIQVVEVDVESRDSDGERAEKSPKPAESIDTYRQDEAVRVIQEYIAGGGQQDWSELEEKRLKRKVDWKLIPVLAITFFFQYYDKTIMSQAVSLPVASILSAQDTHA